jgi:hypothetical protein
MPCDVKCHHPRHACGQAGGGGERWALGLHKGPAAFLVAIPLPCAAEKPMLKRILAGIFLALILAGVARDFW